MKFFEDVPGSITSFEFYTSKVNQRSWDTFKYLFLLVLVVGTGLATQFYIEANNGLGVLITDLRVGAPDFLLDNGRLQVAGSQPYRWEEGGSLFLIDTRSGVDDSILDRYQQGVILTDTYVTIKDGARLQKMAYSDLGDVTFNKADLMALLPHLKWFILLIAIMMVVFLFIAKLIGSLFLALVGFLASSQHRANLAFHQLWNLSVHALTAPIILHGLIRMTGAQIPYVTIVYWSIAFVYLYQGVAVCTEPPTAPPINGELPPRPDGDSDDVDDGPLV